jgi:hypothetical protein
MTIANLIFDLRSQVVIPLPAPEGEVDPLVKIAYSEEYCKIVPMSKAERTVQDFLDHHRYEPLERDGWYSAYEIYRGIGQDLGKKVRSARVFMALHALHQSVPPIIEDTWMLTNSQGNPITDELYQHPNQPDGARRFYRALQTSIEYIAPE